MATYTSHYPPSYSQTYVKVTTEGPASAYYGYQTCNPSNPLTGDMDHGQWWQATGMGQKFNIDLGEGHVIKRIYYENFHHNGGASNAAGAPTDGVENYIFYGTNEATAFSNTTYATTTDLTQLSSGTFDIHASASTADPKYIVVSNSTSYRYYIFRFADNYGNSDPNRCGVRRIELQTEDDDNSSSSSSSLSMSSSSSSSYIENWSSSSSSSSSSGSSSSSSSSSSTEIRSSSSSSSSLDNNLYYGGTHILVGNEFNVAGTTVIYNYVNNTAKLGDPALLTTIQCTYKNLDGYLNFSGCTALWQIDCYTNELVGIDVTDCISLLTLDCKENSLTTLDVTNNTALTNLSCLENSLTTLDVTNNTALTNLSCGSNALSSMDISQNILLTQFSCDNSSLTELDISNNPLIYDLSIENAALTQEAIDNILEELVDRPFDSATIFLDGVGNSYPSESGQDNVNIMIAKEWEVLVNDNPYSSSSSSGNVFEPYGYLCVEINGSNTKNHYLPLYNNAQAGTHSDRDFWGDIVISPNNLVEAGFLSTTINGTAYWLHIYTADASTGCCSNLTGEFREV